MKIFASKLVDRLTAKLMVVKTSLNNYNYQIIIKYTCSTLYNGTCSICSYDLSAMATFCIAFFFSFVFFVVVVAFLFSTSHLTTLQCI